MEGERETPRKKNFGGVCKGGGGGNETVGKEAHPFKKNPRVPRVGAGKEKRFGIALKGGDWGKKTPEKNVGRKIKT